MGTMSLQNQNKMGEKEILEEIAQAEKKYADALENMAEAKKAWVDAETSVIDTKINLSRLREQLRDFKLSDPNVPIEYRELEIERFRQDHPDLVKWAKERDQAE